MAKESSEWFICVLHIYTYCVNNTHNILQKLDHIETCMNFTGLSVKNFGESIVKHLICMKMLVCLFFPVRVPSSFHWWSTSLSSSTKPTPTQPGLTLWAGSLDCSVFSWFPCGSSLKWLRWKEQYGRYVYSTASSPGYLQVLYCWLPEHSTEHVCAAFWLSRQWS